MQRIIAFTGPAGCGKDACGSHLINKYGFTKLSFAQGLKAMLTAIGFPEPATQALKEEVIPLLGCSWRHLAQTLGTEWGRNCVRGDLWVLLAGEYMRMNPIANFVLTDVRFENEAQQIRDAGGVVVHLRGRRHEMAANALAHASEAGVAQQDGDVVIHNDTDGIDNLHGKIGLALRAWL